MCQLEVLTNADFDAVWNIMENSFPVEERRERRGQEGILAEPCYHFYGCKQEGVLAAFFAVWEFEEFSFIEHFAVEKSHRNGGIGAALLRQLLAEIKAPVILEVEPPEGELQSRRIAFYERNGFVINSYDYIQPAMSDQGRAIPLRIMSSPEKLGTAEYEKIRERLYRYVYRVK